MRALLVLSFWLLGVATAWCQADTMQFEAYPPDTMAEKLMGDHAWSIYADGDIDANAGKRLEALIAERQIPGASFLYLHSPGGSLLGGIELGRVIRKNFLNTYVGQYNPSNTIKSLPGYCLSACALAFLGGEYRFLIDGSVYGVHRFFWKEHTNADADVAQMLSAVVVDYISSMGVDTKLFSLASEAGATQLVTPSPEALLALNVINNGSKPVKWSIESVTGAIYLKGEQETWLGMNKFMLVCPAASPMELFAIFDAGQNTKEVMSWPINWLFADQSQVQIEDHLLKKSVNNGMINLVYRLDKRLLAAIVGAKSVVGVGLSPAPAAAIFNGFAEMPFKGGAAKLPGVLQVCRPQ